MDPSFKDRDGWLAVVDCAGWDDFKVRAPAVLRWVADAENVFERFFFRGQSCSSWGLQSSFDRLHAALTYRQRERQYDRIITAFMRNYDIYGDMDSAARELFKGDGKPVSRLEYETRAQHYGLQTQLMDWSRSLYVSSFFAFSKVEQCTSEMVSVWALDQRRLRQTFSENHVEIIDEVYGDNRRQLWQMGVLVKNKSGQPDMADLFRAASPLVSAEALEGKPLLLRFDLPRTEMRRAADDLDMMRINSVTLFPGIEGVVQWLQRGGFVLGAD